jgi:hypothetical protein
MNHKLFLGHTTAPTATGNCLLLAFASARIGARTLTAHRQIAAMTHTTVTADLYQTLDVHLNFSAQISFNLEIRDCITNIRHLGVCQILDTRITINTRHFENLI